MDNDRIIKELAKKYNKDERVIRSITSSPFLFSKKVINSLEDERPIRIPYMGSFVMRRHRNKEITVQIMILRKVVEDLMKQVESRNIEEDRSGLLQAIMTIKVKLIEKGFKDEQLVQYINEWQNRA